MISAFPISNAAHKASNDVRTDDTFLLEDERYERVYQRRKTRFQALQQQGDVSNAYIFVLSDDKPWEVFRNDPTDGRLQRRKLVFERCRNFPVLHQACVTGDRNQVRILLDTRGVCVLERDACGRIALHHAVMKEHFKIVKRLLRRRDSKLQAHVQDNSNRTSLHYILEKMEVLARHHKGLNIPALITIEMRMESGRYRQLWKLADRMLKMFSQRVLEDERGGESIKVLDMRCRGGVWDVCRSGDLERLEMIVKVYGCSKHELELSELKRTLLHEACENRQLQVVYFLVSTMGLSVLRQDTSGCTALHCAARRGFLDVCQMLLGKTGNAANFRLNDCTEELVLLQDVRGRTALHWCLLGPYNSLIRLQLAVLLAQSCPSVLHICDQDGVSPLHLAIWRGEIKLVQEFITLGANICASAPITQPPYDNNVEKASWAPCGIVFQRRCLRKKEKVVSKCNPVDNLPDSPSNPASSKKRTLDWGNLQHPVEALWYWTQRSNEGNCTSCEMEASTEDELGSESVYTEEELGCRKYGGICRRCKNFTSNNSATATPSTPDEWKFRVLSPLLLALRMCALKRDSESMLGHRVAIVELLLINGAPPDESYGDKDNAVNTTDSSALSEGLRFSYQCSRIIPMLRQYGAKEIKIDSIMRWCFSTSTTAAQLVESVLSQLLDLENVANSAEFLTMLFCQKYFVTLCELWSNKAQNFTLSTIENVATNHERNWLRGNSPWKCIHETLLSWSEPKKRRIGVGNIAIKHLKFICGVVHPERDDILHDRCAWELFEYCVDLSLRQRDNGNSSTCSSDQSIMSLGKIEQTLLVCIQVLFKFWKRSEGDDQRIKSKAGSWLELLILRGYFNCALVILETLHRLGSTHNLLDTVFKLHSSAIGIRSRFEVEQFCHYREFLIVCAENLLKVNSIENSVASARSVVYMCANNLPLTLVESCFEAVLPDKPTESTQDKSNALTAIKDIRVRGKTMVQWILVHDRCDIMRWLLNRIPPGIDRGLYWSEFAAASTAQMVIGDGKESCCATVLFTLYREDVHTHLGLNKSKDLLTNLMVRIAIPTDSVELMERLLMLWEMSDSDRSESSGTEHIENYLKQTGVLHSVARWNAVRIAGFCLSGQYSSDETRSNHVNWQQIFSEEKQHRHESDECTPLELCRMLGHNHLYNFLFSRLQPSIPAVNLDDVVETNDSGSMGNNDNDYDPKGHCQVGLLRSIIHINVEIVRQGKSDERFTGYQRHAKIQDPWMSAVAQNQIPHLQAMSLSSHSNISVRTLILAAIKASSLNALKWILEANAPITTQFSDEEGAECLYAAAKHSGDAYAEMTLLLLENQLNPGRLSGDGMGIPLLHRAACFSNSSLAVCIMTLLLKRSDCDVNALDAFGNTAVSYAIATGCIHNACFLIQSSKCRLEAEYEGQSCFYYTLHLVPSFAWRAIVRELLITKRARAFLHCDADNKTCGCKGYEGEAGDCGFCGHESMRHRLTPLPSWFRDQYDTYIVTSSTRKRASSDESVDSEMSRQYLTDKYDASCDEDEETVLENRRGRLDVELLKKITTIRYGDIVQANGLNGAVVVDAQIAEETVTNSPELNTLEQVTVFQDCVSMEARDLQQNASKCVGLNVEEIHRDAKRGKKFTGPWWLQQELAMVHSPRCLCQSSAFVTSETQLAHVAVCRWLRRTAIIHMPRDETESAIIALASVQPAFEHWRDVVQHDKQLAIEAVASPFTPLPRFLNNVLFHWRHSKQFLAFHRWKNFQTSTEVAHHRLETRLEAVAAEMRRNRFLTLQQRHHQLLYNTRSLKLTK